jgi:hypothetical protein
MQTKSGLRLQITMSKHDLARCAKLHKCMMRTETETPLLPIVQIEYIVLN